MATPWTKSSSPIPFRSAQLPQDAALRRLADIKRWCSDPESMDEIRKIPELLPTPQLVNMVIGGKTPATAIFPWATSAPMGISDIAKVESPYYPEHRIPFLWALAERQWTLAELSAGLAWRKFHADNA